MGRLSRADDAPGQRSPDEKIPTAFLARRFTPAADKYASQIERFLKAAGVEIVSGEGYEPRSISQKVRDRISSGDFLILLVTTDGESAWTRDELNLVPPDRVIVLVEEGAKFEPGIHADREYIPFKANGIETAFTALLEGIRYIRASL